MLLHLLKVTYGLLLPLTFFFPRISVPLLIFITILTVLTTWKQRANFSVRHYLNKNTLTYSLLVIIFFVWSAISCLWSPYPLQSLNSFFAFLGLIVIGIAHVFVFLKLEQKVQKQLIYALLIGSLITSIIMLADSFASSPWSAYKGFDKEKLYAKVAMGISFTGLLGWYYIKQRTCKVVFTIVLATALLYSDCDAAILAYFSGLFAYFLVSIPKLQKPITIMTVTLTPICFLLLPLILSKSGMDRDLILNWNKAGVVTHNSTLHRLVILSETAETIEKNPLLGHGYNTSKFDEVNGGDKMLTLADRDLPNLPLFNIEYKAVHPHNFIMQLWLELGFIGVALWLAFTLMVLNIMSNNLNRYRLAYSVFLCAHIHLLVSIGLWQSWWWALVAIIIPCVIFQKKTEHPQEKDQLS